VIGLILGAIVAVAAVVIVSLPFLRDTGSPELHEATAKAERRLALLEDRDRALAALKELEFDHRSGKIDDADYRESVGPLRRAAADALQALDRLDSSGPSELDARARSDHEMNVGQVPPALVEVEAVPGEELVGDGEADVADR
jgi:hypothetical protein